jgi:AcrR family transcriptional regulator
MATVEALVEAAARVLVEDGYAKASTNRIAKVAGVSVGSLYQYFPNKESLVLAVVDRHLEEVTSVVSTLSVALGDAPIVDAVRATIGALAAMHHLNPELQEVLDQQVRHLALPRIRESRGQMMEVLFQWLEQRQDDLLPKDLRAATFVIYVAVETVTHERRSDPKSDHEAVLEEVTAMVYRYLVGAASP